MGKHLKDKISIVRTIFILTRCSKRQCMCGVVEQLREAADTQDRSGYGQYLRTILEARPAR
jgi:hypothetical protein